MIKLGLDKIKELCTKASFERGQRYLEEGRVKIKDVSPSKVTAVVAGTSNYRVEINLEDKDISATCTCPYDWEGYCKHIIATLLAVEEDRGEIESIYCMALSRLIRSSVLGCVEKREAIVLPFKGFTMNI